MRGEASETSFFILFDVCENNSVMVKEYGIQEIERPIYEESLGGNYSIIFTSVDEKTLLKYGFDVRFIIHSMEIDPKTGEIKERWVKRECVEMYFRFPFFENTSKIKVLHFDTPIYEMEICNYDKICEKNRGETTSNCPDCLPKPICGNKICEEWENQENCCLDCGCPHGYKCLENKCIKTTSPLIYFILIGVVIILLTIIIFKSKKVYEKPS
jgi:hypothetical protein